MLKAITYQPAVIAAVAFPLSGAAVADGSGSQVALAVVAGVLWAVAIGLVIRAPRSIRATPSLLFALAALTLLLLWAAISFRWTGDDGAGFPEVVRLAAYLGVVAVVGVWARPGSGPSVLAGIGVSGVVIACVALVSRVTGLGGDADIAVILPPAAQRLSAPIGYWNALGYLMAMSLPAVIMCALDAGRLRRLAVAGSIPLVLALYLTASRGAALAAVLALALVVVTAPDRGQVRQTGLVLVPAWAFVVVLAAVMADPLAASGEVSISGLAVLAAVALLAFVAQLLVAPSRRRSPLGSRAPRLRGVYVAAALSVLAAVVVILGPSTLIGDFRASESDDTSLAAGFASDSGRSAFWGAAVDAFAEDPLRGLGIGSYANYWNANGTLSTPVRNAHSLPLETAAELGLVGLAAIIGFFLVAGLAAAGRIRGAANPLAPAAAAGVLAAGLVSVTIDWTWQVPAAIAPLLIVAGLACGRGLLEKPSAKPEPAVGWLRPLQVPAPLGAPVVVALGLVTIWASVLLGAGSFQLERARSRLEAGDLNGAAAAARSAAQIQPWSGEAPLLLAELEEAGTNLGAARRRAEQAVRLAPTDFRTWLLLAYVNFELGNRDAGIVYAIRAVDLGQAVVDRAFTRLR